jgi:hypothetical protein
MWLSRLRIGVVVGLRAAALFPDGGSADVPAVRPLARSAQPRACGEVVRGGSLHPRPPPLRTTSRRGVARLATLTRRAGSV